MAGKELVSNCRFGRHAFGLPTPSIQVRPLGNVAKKSELAPTIPKEPTTAVVNWRVPSCSPKDAANTQPTRLRRCISERGPMVQKRSIPKEGELRHVYEFWGLGCDESFTKPTERALFDKDDRSFFFFYEESFLSVVSLNRMHWRPSLLSPKEKRPRGTEGTQTPSHIVREENGRACQHPISLSTCATLHLAEQRRIVQHADLVKHCVFSRCVAGKLWAGCCLSHPPITIWWCRDDASLQQRRKENKDGWCPCIDP